MSEVEIKAWEKAVETRFAEWIFARTIERRYHACIKSKEFSSEDAKIVRDTVYEFIGDELLPDDTYIPLAGNMEKMLGDAFSLVNSKFSLLEIKAHLIDSTANREWDPPSKNAKNKDRGALFKRLTAGENHDVQSFMELSGKCHFIMGLDDVKEDEFQLKEMVFCQYWPFVDPAVHSRARLALDRFPEQGVDFKEFCVYVDTLLADAQNCQEDACDEEIRLAERGRNALAELPDTSADEIRKADQTISAMKETCEKLKKLQAWKLENTKLKLVIHRNGTIQAIDAKLPTIKNFLVSVEKKALTASKPAI